ncbi:MAG: hypothetical protein HFE63_01075 [Clostridiales bacterium]|nr:hypothetical protein [Clostridiales bacterium]
MINIKEAIKIAGEMFIEREGRKMTDGDEFIAAFNNCTAAVSLEDGKFDIHFIDNAPLIVDADVDVYSKED